MSRWQRLAFRAKQFDPRSISGLGVWLDASDAASLTLNGNTVSEWRDKSGNARHFSQATAAAQPNAVNVTRNGRRVLDFAGAQSLNGNAATLNIARNVGGLTMLVVGKRDTTAVASEAFLFVSRNGNAAQSRASLAYNFGLNRVVAGGRRTDADAFASSGYTPGANATNESVYSGVLNYAASDAFIFLNGMQQASNTAFQTDGNTANTDSDAVIVGSIGDGTQLLDGWVAEIIVYQRALSADERRLVERYLGRKWGITVA